MSRFKILVGVLLLVFLAACGGAPEPEVQITSHEESATINTETVTIEGTVNAAVTELSYTLNGGAPQDISFEGGTFSFEVSLDSGLNAVTVTAEDAQGRASTDTVSITYDPDIMVMIITPEDGAVVNDPTITVVGTVNDEVTELSYTLNDFAPVSITPEDGVFSFDDTLDEGLNTFTVTAVDAEGTEATASVEVTYTLSGVAHPGSLTADDPTFVRPDLGSGLTDAQRTLNYDVSEAFSVTSTGRYQILSEQTYDGYLLLYRDSFDPAAPETNLVAANDDFGGAFDEDADPAGTSGFVLELEAGVSYLLVTTACGDPEVGCGPNTGDYVNSIISGAPPPPPPFELPEPDNARYNITFRFAGDTDRLLTDEQKQVFLDAAARWEAIITGDIVDIPGELPANVFFQNTGPVIGPFDDVLIDVNFTNIDGPAGVLGRAGPLIVRSAQTPEGEPLEDPYLTVYGIMEFDISEFGNDGFFDVQEQYESTIVHEMGHVLGIGTLWEATGNTVGIINEAPPTVPPGLPNPDYDPRFIGAGAVAEYQDYLAIAGKPSEDSVPIANTGGPGNYNGHWRELTFENEMMTPYAGGRELLSSMTAASLGDVGYTVELTSPAVDADYFLPLPAEFAQVAPSTVTYVEFEDFLKFSGAAGEVTAPVQAVDLYIDTSADPNNPDSRHPVNSTSGCEASDFEGFTAGNIALMQRGTCAFVQKVDNAVAAGAVGVVMFNQGDDPEDPARMGLFKPSVGSNPLPAVAISFDLGVELANTAGLELFISTPVPTETSGIQAQSLGGAELKPINEILVFPTATINQFGKVMPLENPREPVLIEPQEIQDH